MTGTHASLPNQLARYLPCSNTGNCHEGKVTLNMPSAKENVVFFHPDLGIGGAERLVIDAAVGLQNRGHKVTIFTSHCDKNHCFPEARDGTWRTDADI
jgi:hypothetical protein